MMKYLISVIFALGVIGPSAALAAERTVTLAVQNMYCAACPHTVKSRQPTGRFKGIQT
jgi:periplasmic mercuric ion binding protein